MLHGINMASEVDGTGMMTGRPLAWEREAPEPSLTAIPLPEAPAALPRAVQACGRVSVSCVVDVTDRERGRGGEGRRLRRG